MKSLIALFLATSLISLSPIVFAQGEEGASEDLQTITEQQLSIQADLEDDGIEGLTPRQSNLVRKAQKEFFLVTEGKSALDQLSIEDKIRMRNSLETINAQLVGTRAAGASQEVCWREAKTGSSVKVTRCGTQEERDRAREGARDWLQRPKICAPPGCGV